MVKGRGGYTSFFSSLFSWNGASCIATGRYFACNQDLESFLDQFIMSSNRSIRIVIIMYNEMGAPRCTDVRTSGAGSVSF
jgi:hypothetical protein